VLEKQLALDSMKQNLDKLSVEKDDAYASLLKEMNTTESNLRKQVEFLTLEKENMTRDGE
jgi:hypothetical protein